MRPTAPVRAAAAMGADEAPSTKRRRVEEPTHELVGFVKAVVMEDFHAHAARRRQRYRAHWDAYLTNQNYYTASETPVVTASPYIKAILI
ncbi:hypothetical protein ACHHYP_10919 [Achlya hypogyna]|uniref:Uncharacterized protein n=1 Tax=Achlya hypogyna TaxID=1202772 RepID=A0A1V9YKC2_ACHHY|nr:hypothetical protein ACHHYP_10919 [Achlya hypogyna]